LTFEKWGIVVSAGAAWDGQTQCENKADESHPSLPAAIFAGSLTESKSQQLPPDYVSAATGVPQIADDLLQRPSRQGRASSGHFRVRKQMRTAYASPCQLPAKSIVRLSRLALPYLNLKFSRVRSASDRQPINFISRSISE
jgi:hypothetical protein